MTKKEPVQIFYGTCSGNTELVCQAVQKSLSANFDVTLHQVDITSPEQILSEKIILACPTYAHGELFTPFQKFLSSIPLNHLAGKKVAIIGLGDDKYDNDYTVEAATILEDFAKTQDAQISTELLRIVKSPVGQIKQKVEPWAQNLSEVWRKS